QRQAASSACLFRTATMTLRPLFIACLVLPLLAAGPAFATSTGISLDESFQNPQLNQAVYAMAVAGDGKIVVGGNFTAAGPT
ncbi:hypothetical protein OFO11_39210, partial [Escherichia coli]|nr:hypothetical protein [Escherichia coli]